MAATSEHTVRSCQRSPPPPPIYDVQSEAFPDENPQHTKWETGKQLSRSGERSITKPDALLLAVLPTATRRIANAPLLSHGMSVAQT